LFVAPVASRFVLIQQLTLLQSNFQKLAPGCLPSKIFFTNYANLPKATTLPKQTKNTLKTERYCPISTFNLFFANTTTKNEWYESLRAVNKNIREALNSKNALITGSIGRQKNKMIVNGR
jgi:hypothetical protein